MNYFSNLFFFFLIKKEFPFIDSNIAESSITIPGVVFVIDTGFVKLKYFDIAQHNKILFDKCDSAELEKTYLCLQKMNLTQKYNKYSDIINKFTKMKAHNPLTDAYYTWVIFNIFQLKKV